MNSIQSMVLLSSGKSPYDKPLMIDLPSITRHYADRLLFLSGNNQTSYREFESLFMDCVEEMDQANASGQSIIIEMDWTAASFARLLAALHCGYAVFLNPIPEGAELEPFLNEGPLLILRTGGTTGSPKHVVHSINTLLKPYKLEHRNPRRILILYTANHIAGLDAFFQALHRGSTLVIPSSRDPQSVLKAAKEFHVDVLPATPTFLQLLLLSGGTTEADLTSVKVIPHGAEPMPFPLRARIKKAFPNARLAHRFGLTELGALPVREDPEDPDALFLDAEGCEWKLVNGEVFIRGRTPFLGTLEEGRIPEGEYWHPTGDIGQLTEQGSMKILGRKVSLINVGGEKILPETVESLLLEHPSVKDACVKPADSALTGQTVTAEVIFKVEPDPTGLIRDLRKSVVQSGLSLAHVPTRIHPVESLDKTSIGKRSRIEGNP